MKIISNNRKAYYNFEILNKLEAGIVLKGSEVKSLRLNKASLTEAYIVEKKQELWVQNLQIAQYKFCSPSFNHDPKRMKKVLLRRKEINKLIGKIKEEKISIIPLTLFINDKNIIKITIGVGKGKKKHDKRETIKQREWQRKKAQLL